MGDLTTKLRAICGHDSWSVPECTLCEVADHIDAMRRHIAKQKSQLRTLAEAVLEAHVIEEWDAMEDQIVERPCQCEACKLAREVMDGK